MNQEALQGYRISPAQFRLWKLRQSGGGPYVSRAIIRIEGVLEVARLKKAVEIVVSRHEALRAGFHVLPGMSIPVQIIGEAGFDFDETFCELAQKDGLNISPGERLPELESGASRLSCRLLCSPNRTHLLVTVPAWCADGISMNFIVNEIADIYNGATDNGIQIKLLQYPDIAEWLNELQEAEDCLPGRRHWSDAYADLADSLPVYGVNAPSSSSMACMSVELGPEFQGRLLAEARKNHESVCGTLLAAWKSLLDRLDPDRRSDCLAVLLDGRSEETLKNAIGPLARYVPVRLGFEIGDSVQSASAKTVEAIREAAEWQSYFDWNLIVDNSVGGGACYMPVSFEYIDVRQDQSAGRGVQFTIEDLYAYGDCFELQLSCKNYGRTFCCELRWDQSKRTRKEVSRLARGFAVEIRQMVGNPEASIHEVNLMEASESTRLIADFNGIGVAFGNRDLLLHEIFESQSRQTPDAIAVAFEEKSLSYRDLNQLADRVAASLWDRGIGPEALVGVCLDRSLELVIALLGVLKTGAAYVPLDPQYPKERLRFMLHDSSASCVITASSIAARLDWDGIELIDIQLICGPAVPAQRAFRRASGKNPAYVIYTSGSTGAPKGVVVTNEAIGNHMAWMSREFPLTTADTVLQKTAFSFDASVWEFYAPLLAGGSLVMARPGGQQDREYLLGCIRDRQITVLQLVPSQLNMLLEDEALKQCTSLRLVFCGGEALPLASVRCFYEMLPQATLYNLYGPTEATIDTTWGECSSREFRPQASIGKPIANMRVYVTDENFQVVPAEIRGALCIAGIGLARGYLKRPDLTAERFVPDPFSPSVGERMYWTGDVATWDEDGHLHFLGRLDNQIKLRGYRIELGEIEGVLQEHAAVVQAAVLVREDRPGDQRLIAYVVLNGKGVAIEMRELQEYLKARLPEYMVPVTFIELKDFPLTPNGKVARQSLPRLEDISVQAKKYRAPRNPQEEIICGIFATVLKQEHVGIDGNFLEMGGHSLLATQIVSRIRSIFRIDLPLRTLFEAPTPGELVLQIENALRSSGTSAPALVPVQRNGNLLLSFAQQRLWLVDQLDPGSAAYNMPFSIRLRGDLDRAALRRAFLSIIQRHEVLRTCFPMADGAPVQEIAEVPELVLEEMDMTGMSVEEREAAVAEQSRRQAIEPFDLIQGPLLRISLLQLGESDHVLLATIHHIVTDGWSTQIIIRELAQLYDAYSRGEQPILPELEIQYADFAAWQRHWIQGEMLREQLDYWKEQLADLPPLRLSYDYPRPNEKNYSGRVISFALSGSLTEELKKFSCTEGVTLFMTLLAAFQAILSIRSGQTDLAVGTGIAGRNQLGIEGLIGFFVNTLVLRARFSPGLTFRGLLGQVRQTTFDAYRHQDLPFDKLVQEMQLERDLARTPLFQAMFIFQNTVPREIHIPGIEVTMLREEFLPVRSDIDLYMVNKETLEGNLVFDPELFEYATIQNIVGEFTALLENIVLDPLMVIMDTQLRN
jgi:amino acid adenylation domain-containing protein